MKALLLNKDINQKLTIQDVPRPEPQPGEVVVALKAAALNHRDLWCVEGKYPGIQYPAILGSDGAGEVVEVGLHSDEDWLGKPVIINPNINWGQDPKVQAQNYEILGMPSQGCFAEFISVPVDRLHIKPPHLTFQEAAALPLCGLTAYRSLFTHGQIKADHDLLISGIGGGVAQFVFLFAKHFGVNIFVTSGSDQKIAWAVNHGAKAGFNYALDNWIEKLQEKRLKFDVIVDSAGGDQLNALIHLCKPGGKVVFYGATNGLSKNLDLRRMFWQQLTLQGSTMGNDKEFTEMVDIISRNQLRPSIDTIFSFSEIIDAFAHLKSGAQMGKVVVDIT